MKAITEKFPLRPTIIVILALLLIGYLFAANGTCPQTELITPVENPISNSIERVWPSPNDKISLYCYYTKTNPVYAIGRGVGAGLSVSGIDRLIWKKPATSVTPIFDRTVLYIDDKVASKSRYLIVDPGLLLIDFGPNGETISSGRSAGYYVSWVPFLLPGTHTALIEITRDTGEVIKYTWTFIITLL